MAEEYDKTTCWYNDYVVTEMNAFYDDHVKHKAPAGHLNTFAELLKLVNGSGNLLDLGCGTASLAPHCKEFVYYGADLAHVISGCAMRNFPIGFYRVSDIVWDNLSWIENGGFKVVVMNALLDVMQQPTEMLEKLLPSIPHYLLIHRQEITEEGETRVTKKTSYTGQTYHSIINRKEFNAILEKYNMEIIKELCCSFDDWENGGSSFLLKRKNSMSKYFNNTLRQMRNTIMNAKTKNIVLGAGDVYYGPEWIATNIEDLDITNEDDWKFFFGNTKADNIVAEHVFEHLTEKETYDALRNIYNFMKKGGNFRIAVPDGLFPDQGYIDHVKPNGIGAGSDDHKVLYTHKTFMQTLSQVPFRVEMMEYWDEQGKFHYNEWDVKLGTINRSKRFDERNADGVLKYTSLIADATR
jgi:predicted SAM-dependent methyltransferase